MDAQPAHRANDEEAGFLILALVGTVLPVMLVLGAASLMVNGGNARMLEEVRQEKALVAAESGIDEALYRASTSTGLKHNDLFARVITPGLGFKVEASYLRIDGIDNDGDGFTDEPDENTFRVISTGSYRGAVRRLVTYLGPSSTPISVHSAFEVQNPGRSITLQGASTITGRDTKLDGTRGLASNDVPGMIAAAPATAAHLLSELSGSERSKITGSGLSTPSLGSTMTPTDVGAMRLAIQNAANMVLTSDEYENADLGSGPDGRYNVIFRDGALTLKGTTTGAGILFVTGDLLTKGRVRFDGIIIVLGHVEAHGTTNIYGGVITGPSAEHITLEGTVHVHYSTEAITAASSRVPTKFSAFNGWQEIARK